MASRFGLALVGLVGWLAVAAYGQGIVYVNSTTGDDAWDGRCEVWDGGTCGPKATIQAGVNVTETGDEVLIAAGVYTGAGNKDVDFGGQEITVRSATDDPTSCIIDCENSGRGFVFQSYETQNAVLRGLTICSANYSSDSGAVYCFHASPTIANCIIIGNSVAEDSGVVLGYSEAILNDCRITGNGGYGVDCTYSTATITNCEIDGNIEGGVRCTHASPTFSGCIIRDNSGAGVRSVTASNPTLTGCTIAGNSAWAGASGGGVFCYGAGAVLNNCLIADNHAWSGAGLYSGSNSALTLTNCVITRNATSTGPGGGLQFTAGGSATLTNCAITDNAADYGAGVLCQNVSPVLVNCAILRNSASASNISALSCSSASPTLVNCTISGNTGAYGVFVSGSTSNLTLTNCILWNDSGQELRVYSGSATLTYCDIAGGWAGTGNINVDPAFAFAGDGHLLPGSPCIDAGTNSPPVALPDSDVDGNPRVLDGDGGGGAVADIGAYEFNAAVPSIALSTVERKFALCQYSSNSQSVALRNSSLGVLSWWVESQTPWLTAEPAAGESSGEIDTTTLTVDTSELSPGTYTTTLWVHGPGASNDPRAVRVSVTVRACLQVPEVYQTIQAAVDAAGEGDEIVIADGIYTGPGNKDVDIYGKTITVRSASGNPDACVIDCEGSGRAFWLRNYATAVIAGLTIQNGSASGIRCYTATMTLIHCVLRNNVGGAGGGLYCYWSSPTLINCEITGNTAASSGGAICCDDSDFATLINCTIADNTALTGHGGAIYSAQGGATLNNCILWGDWPDEIYALGGMLPPELNWCDIQGGWLGSGNFSLDPLFHGDSKSRVSGRGPSDNRYWLLALSPCIDAGRNSAVPADQFDVDGDNDLIEPLPLDLSLRPRFVDYPFTWDVGAGTPPLVDIGAYEYQLPSCAPGDLNCDGWVNAFDIDPFVLALTTAAEYIATYPDCDYGLADINGDRTVNAFDIDPFVLCLTGGGCGSRP